MSTPDIDVIKEIPGYKVILKAILKMQIQQLVEQLASHTEEESVILTASVSDGTLSHLGSDSGKFFLDDHEDIKSQFLGFCLKRHHKKKQQEKEKEALVSPPRMSGPHMKYGGPRYGSPRMPMRSPQRYSSPQGVHPVALSRASPGSHMRSPGPRHEPYPITRPQRRPSLNLDQSAGGSSSGAMKLPLGSKIDNQVIKIEPEDSDTNGSDSNVTKQSETNIPSSSQPSSPSQTNKETSQSADKDEDATNSSTSTIPNESNELKFSDTQPAEGLSLDSDLSNLLSGEMNAPSTSDGAGKPSVQGSQSDTDPNVNVKVEAITESEMELEITGVELGHGSTVDPIRSPDMWGQPGGATGSPSDMQGGQQGYRLQEGRAGFSMSPTGKTKHECEFCGMGFWYKSHLDRHVKTHTGQRPFVCPVCQKGFIQKNNWKLHVFSVHRDYYMAGIGKLDS